MQPTCPVPGGAPVGATASVLRRFRFPTERRRDFVPLMILTVASIVGTALAPVLRHEGLLIAMLSPRLVFLGMAAQHTSIVPFVLLASLRLCIADPFHYRLGRAYGPAILGRLGFIGRALTRFGSRSAIVIAAVTLRPIGRHLMWAGTKGINPILVTVADVTSTVAYCIAVKTGVSLLPI
ncbi:MAG: hypothetical protein R2715_07460 [Ilumatobacteraceae bacterium]